MSSDEYTKDIIAGNFHHLRPSKEATIKAAISLTPQYTQLLRDLQRSDGHIHLRPEIATIQERNGFYVELYDNELKLGIALLLALLGEEEFHKLKNELKNATPEEQQKFLDEIAEESNWDEIVDLIQIPDTPQGWAAARQQFEALSIDDQQQVAKCSALFWSYLFGSFFNILALMVHGEKLTVLVPKAINGDDTAFMRALQTDRMLMQHHPYFKERRLRAQNEGDKNFLRRIASREATPLLHGQIQLPGLYMVFGILESYNWLDNMKPREILDICVNAGLDQHHNRIDDVGYLSIRLREYRKWQKTQRMSRI